MSDETIHRLFMRDPVIGHSSYRPEIDGLRAIAVVAVIIHHFAPDFLPNGYLGVDIFFVISGFVITSSLARHSGESLFDFLFGFYARRCKRLLPALIFFVVVMSVLVCLVIPEPGTALRLGSRALFGLANLELFQQANDYFAKDNQLNPFLHTWSLGVEEQFYFFFPMLAWLAGFARLGSNKGRSRLFVLMLLLSLVSLIAFLCNHEIHPVDCYYLMPYRLWELSAGVLLFLLISRFQRGSFSFAKSLSFVVLIVLLVVLSCSSIPSAIASFVVVLLVTILIGSLLANGPATAFLSLPALVLIGQMSYSLYLWHWGILSISRWTIGIGVWSFLALISMAAFSYFYVEKPWRYRKWSRHSVAVVAKAFAATCITAFLLHLLPSNGRLFLAANAYQKVRAFRVNDDQLSCTSSITAFQHFNGKLDVNRCTFYPTSYSNNDTLPRIWYLGNSHSAHLSGMIEALLPTIKAKQTMLYAGGMPMPPLPESFFQESGAMSSLVAYQKQIADHLVLNAKKNDVVVLGNALSLLFAHTNTIPAKVSVHRIQYWPEWFASLQRFVEALEQRGVKVVVLLPAPTFPSQKQFSKTGICYTAWFKPVLPSSCEPMLESREFLITASKRLRVDLERLARQQPNLFLFDPFSILCPPKFSYCSSVIDGAIVYDDDNHLNNAGGALLASHFSRFLRDHHLLKF